MHEVHQQRKAFPLAEIPSGEFMPLFAPTILDKIQGAEQTHTLVDAECAAFFQSSGVSFSVSPISVLDAKSLKYYQNGKKVSLTFEVNGANIGQAQVDEFLIKLPSGFVVTNRNYRSVGSFVNVTGGVESGIGKQQTATLIRVGSGFGFSTPGDAIRITAIRNQYEEFDCIGTNTTVLTGQIEFTID